MGKNTSEWDREVCSTMRGVVSQVTLAAWSNITILQECFWGDKHSLWFNCTTEAYTEKCLHMISNSSVSLPGLDNCYQKTLPSNKIRHPYYIKTLGLSKHTLNYCGIISLLGVMLSWLWFYLYTGKMQDGQLSLYKLHHSRKVHVFQRLIYRLRRI